MLGRRDRGRGPQDARDALGELDELDAPSRHHDHGPHDQHYDLCPGPERPYAGLGSYPCADHCYRWMR